MGNIGRRCQFCKRECRSFDRHLLDAEGATFSGNPGLVERAVEGVQFDLVHDSEFDGAGVGSGGIALLSHFICFGAGPLLSPLAKLFRPFLDAVKGVEGGVLGDGFDVVKACQGRAGGVHGDFGHEQGSIEDVRVLADRCDGTQPDGIFPAGETALPATDVVLVIIHSLKRLFITLALFPIHLFLLLGGAATSRDRSRLGNAGEGGDGEGYKEGNRFHCLDTINRTTLEVKV